MRGESWPDAPDDHPLDIDQYSSRSDDTRVTLVAESAEGGLCGFIEVGTRP